MLWPVSGVSIIKKLLQLCYKKYSLCVFWFFTANINDWPLLYKVSILQNPNIQQLLGNEREVANGKGYMVDENNTPSVLVAGKYFLLPPE